MEKPEWGTLKPCLNPTLNFPPPQRRRPLRSQTYCTFVRILSHCRALETSSKRRSEDGNEGDKLGEADNRMVNESCMEVESLLVRQMSPLDEGKDAKLAEVSKGIVNESSMEVESSSIQQMLPINGAKDASKDVDSFVITHGTEQLTPGDRFPVNEVHDTANQPTNMLVVADMLSNKLSPRREQDIISMPFIIEADEAASQPTSVKVIASVPEPAKSFTEKDSDLVADFSEGFQHQLQLKQSELEELLSASGNLDLSVYDLDDEHIEDGEILDGCSVDDKAMDMLLENDISSKDKKLDEVLISEVDERELENANAGDREIEKNKIESSLLLDQVEGSTDVMKPGTSTGEEQKPNPKSSGENVSLRHANGYDYNMDTGWLTKQVIGVEKSNIPRISFQNGAQRRQITYEDISENRDAATAPTKVDVAKKRKKGPLTEERKAKKKKNYRIKRAEKNKKLGVRRLKLQPVLKPKKVVYCRHYLQGRCHEGEKCKFSHDTTPVTKSTPCSFFARHSCMKGDDCPFDHELSKYPCNNIVTKGFCSRGAECLFKHQEITKDASLNSHPSKLESSSPILMTNDFKNQVSKEGITNQRINAILPKKENSTRKVSENQVLKNLERSVAHVPKGISFISPVITPTGNTNKHEGASSHLKEDNQAKTSSSMASNSSSNLKKSNERLDKVPMKPPKGINFLSISKSPIDNSANTKTGDSGSFLCLLTNNGGVSSSPGIDGCVKTDHGATIGSSESVSALNKIAMDVPPCSTPQGIKFLSVGSFTVNNVNSSVSQSSNSFDSVNSGQASIQGKQTSVEAITFLNRTGNGPSSSSSHPPLQSSNQGARIFGGGTSSSSAKASLQLNTPTSVQSALHHSLEFAANIESKIKLDRPAGNNPFSLSRK